MTNKKNILEKINIDIQNSNKVITNPYYFEFSKLQIFIYSLLNIKIIFSFIKFFIKIAKYLEFVINTKNLILTKLDPNISSKLNKKKSLKINHELNQEYGYDEFSEIKRFYTNVKIVNTKNNAGLFFDRINYSVNETVKIINLDQNIKKLKSVGCSYAHFENIIAQDHTEENIRRIITIFTTISAWKKSEKIEKSFDSSSTFFSIDSSI